MDGDTDVGTGFQYHKHTKSPHLHSYTKVSADDAEQRAQVQRKSYRYIRLTMPVLCPISMAWCMP